MRLIERTARWVDPATFRLLPVWFPEHSRLGILYKAGWSAPQMNRNRQTGIEVHKHEGEAAFDRIKETIRRRNPGPAAAVEPFWKRLLSKLFSGPSIAQDQAQQ